MKGFPLGLFRAANFSRFLFFAIFLIIFPGVFLNIGCSPGNLTIGIHNPPPPAGGAFVFTANAGGNNISGFANDGAGNLTAVPGSPFASPGQPFGLAATPNNAFLYVSSFQNAQVTGFSINATTGTLTPLACPVATTGSQPLKIAINPAGTLLYTANQAGSVSGFAIISTTGCLTPISTTATDSVARGLTIDGTGQFLYVVTGGGGIDLFTINTNGTLTRQVIGGFDSGTTTMLAVKAVPGINVLLATDGGSTNNLRSFIINTTTGALTPIIVTVAGSSPPNPSAIAVNTPASATNPQFYVANTASNNLTVNTIAADGTTGASSLTVVAATGPIDLAVDPTGKFLYVANNGASTVSAFNANVTAANVNSVFISAVGTGAAPESIVVVGHP
ncbi:MAG TPA: beta-propeller fold lactonase family protein [Candidatus Angelobacter sp.]|nr:beta-propeller fold lactonase family protein [Candidatus Angelobacter sp.]